MSKGIVAVTIVSAGLALGLAGMVAKHYQPLGDISNTAQVAQQSREQGQKQISFTYDPRAKNKHVNFVYDPKAENQGVSFSAIPSSIDCFYKEARPDRDLAEDYARCTQG